MKTKLTLCKHPYENRYLMCWYNLQVEKTKFPFRASEFVSEEIDEQLRHLHCVRYTKSGLEADVTTILEPYFERIFTAYQEYKLNPNDEKFEDMFQ